MKQEFKIVVCPHTQKEVVTMYNPGDTDGFPDYLCLHNDDDIMDAEDVEYFKATGEVKPRTYEELNPQN